MPAWRRVSKWSTISSKAFHFNGQTNDCDLILKILRAQEPADKTTAKKFVMIGKGKAYCQNQAKSKKEVILYLINCNKNSPWKLQKKNDVTKTILQWTIYDPSILMRKAVPIWDIEGILPL